MVVAPAAAVVAVVVVRFGGLSLVQAGGSNSSERAKGTSESKCRAPCFRHALSNGE